MTLKMERTLPGSKKVLICSLIIVTVYSYYNIGTLFLHCTSFLVILKFTKTKLHLLLAQLFEENLLSPVEFIS